MRLVGIEWGKFKVELPGEIIIFLLLGAASLFRHLNV